MMRCALVLLSASLALVACQKTETSPAMAETINAANAVEMPMNATSADMSAMENAADSMHSPADMATDHEAMGAGDASMSGASGPDDKINVNEL